MPTPPSNSTASTPDKVAGEARRSRNRKRTKSATTLRRIQAKARERQGAWTEGDRPNDTARLTHDLDGLFGEGRVELAGSIEPGSPTTNRMYRA